MPVETPRKASRICPPHAGSTTTQDEFRAQLLKETDSYVVHCQSEPWMHYFKNSIKCQDSTIEYIRVHLLGKQTIQSNGWSFLLGKKQGTEDRVYAVLGDIAKDIFDAARTHDTKLLQESRTLPTPSNWVAMDVASYRVRPDIRVICLLLPNVPAAPPPPAASSLQDAPDAPATQIGLQGPSDKSPIDFSRAGRDIRAIGEVKLANTPRNRKDNESKIASAAAQLLYNDPCRTSMFAMTIEASILRLWHLNRSRIAVTEDIDINESPDALIVFLLFAMCANQEQLGFDKTMRLVQRAGKSRYQMKVHDTWYETVDDPLSEDAACRLIGRATRVWKARAVCEGKVEGEGEGEGALLTGEVCAIKDVWSCKGNRLESAIMKDIYDRLSKKPEIDLQDAKSHFLTILDEELILTEHEPPIQLIAGSRGYTDVASPIPAPLNGARRSTQDAPIHIPLRDKFGPMPKDRDHRRSVVKEVGTTIYNVKSFRELCSCLMSVTKGINYLRFAGYVHRDISAGNCYYLLEQGLCRGRIGDFEYAKPYDEMSGKELLTGTPDFMATEYQERKFYFLPEGPELSDTNDLVPGRDFHFHYYHDLEPVFWIYLWVLCKCVPSNPPVSMDTLGAALSEGFVKFFSHGIDGHARRSHLFRDQQSQDLVELLRVFEVLYGKLPRREDHASVKPGEVCKSGELLRPLHFRLHLRAEYRTLEALPLENANHHFSDKSFTDGPYDALHSLFARTVSVLVPEDAVPFDIPDVTPASWLAKPRTSSVKQLIPDRKRSSDTSWVAVPSKRPKSEEQSAKAG